MCLGCPVVLASFTENKILLASNCLGIKNQLSVNVRVYFWTLDSAPLSHARPQTSATVFPLFKSVFPILGPLRLDQLVNFYKAAAGVFAGTTLADSVHLRRVPVRMRGGPLYLGL